MMSLAKKKLGIAITVPDLAWNAIILGGWGLLIAMALIAAATPASVWLDVKSVHISDAVAGEPPLMRVDRTINADFVGSWLVKVERDYGAGFGPFCSVQGENAYRTDAVLPQPLTLDWWTYPTHCNLPAGRYRVETTWKIEIPFVPEKFVRVMSNTFTVSER